MWIEYVQCPVQPCFVWHCVYSGTVWQSLFPLFQDQKEQVKQTSQRLANIFAFLERTLLRGRVEKREKKRVQEGEFSNIQEAREEREVAVEAIQ